ncbi:MAG: signal transduction histidine kinase, nitrogen specific, NtrB, partial [Phycisphaerales bacterium]|nr:signal transduction histidine kinase, nitrogen specific, NtrB [Phycisphaerales bacterium]
MSARIPLHVLVVEDSDDGCTLLVRKLQHGGYEVTHRRVDSALELGAALDLDHWDLVISDYSMPGFNGLQALKLVQEHGLDVPFILVSGAIGEDVAVEAMNAGAHDYVLKDNLARLIPAVTRELREAQMRHQRASAEQKLREHEESIRESEGRFRQLAESINEVFWIISADGQKMIYISAPYEEIWGRPCHELYANPRAWLQGVHPDDRERLEKAVFTQNGMAERIDEEYRIVRPDETVRWVSARGFPVRNEEGRVYRVAGVCEDITDRRCAQATLLEHQQELERKNHRLAELYQTAQKFVDDVSHEFRTPLTVIKGFAEAINEGLSGPINPQQGEFLELILDRSRDLAQMVDDLLDS